MGEQKTIAQIRHLSSHRLLATFATPGQLALFVAELLIPPTFSPISFLIDRSIVTNAVKMGSFLSRLFSLSTLPPKQILFGGSKTWKDVKTRAVDDTIRGGKSHSDFDISSDLQLATFSGTIVTEILHAGFASRDLMPADRTFPMDFSDYDGILLVFYPDDEMIYSLNLKDKIAPKRPDGRLESIVEYKAFFHARANYPPGTQTRVFLPFSSFKPYYRGRPAEDAPKMDLQNIQNINVMCASLFEKQSGRFSVDLQEISLGKRPGLWAMLTGKL